MTREQAAKILQVSTTASHVEVKSAFRRLAKIYHPDLNSGSNATKNFQILQAAYETMLRPVPPPRPAPARPAPTYQYQYQYVWPKPKPTPKPKSQNNFWWVKPVMALFMVQGLLYVPTPMQIIFILYILYVVINLYRTIIINKKET